MPQVARNFAFCLCVLLPLQVACRSDTVESADVEAPWQGTNETIATSTQVGTIYSVDSEQLEQIIEQNSDQSLIPIPNPDGRTEVFLFAPSSTMSKELQEKFPELRTFQGHLQTNPEVRIRFETGPTGFQAEIREPGRRYYVRPLTETGGKYSSVVLRTELTESDKK